MFVSLFFLMDNSTQHGLLSVLEELCPGGWACVVLVRAGAGALLMGPLAVAGSGGREACRQGPPLTPAANVGAALRLTPAWKELKFESDALSNEIIRLQVCNTLRC